MRGWGASKIMRSHCVKKIIKNRFLIYFKLDHIKVTRQDYCALVIIQCIDVLSMKDWYTKGGQSPFLGANSNGVL